MDGGSRRIRQTSVAVYVGSYTSADRNGRGAGISVFRAGPSGGPWSHVQTLSTADNPSLLRTAPDSRMLYAVHGGRTTISAFEIDPRHGRLAERGSQESGGLNPVDLGFVGGGRFIVTSNYSSGTVAVIPLDQHGRLQPPCQALTLVRPGFGGNEPAASMPHGVTVDVSGQWVLIPCKGLDCVFIYRFESSGRLLPAEVSYAACKTGSGPRHAVFHPRLPILYVVGELGSCVQLFAWNAANGSLREMQILSTLPDTGAAQNAAAEIAISATGEALYASNRGHDSIAHFPADKTTGLLGAADWTSCQGQEPRFFALAPDGRTLHVANQESDTVVSFLLNDAGELSSPSVSAKLGSPSSICFGAPQATTAV